MLKTYRVSVYEYPKDKHLIIFDCRAEDADHANEQAQDMYRESVLNNVIEIPESEYHVAPKMVETDLRVIATAMVEIEWNGGN